MTLGMSAVRGADTGGFWQQFYNCGAIGSTAINLQYN